MSKQEKEYEEMHLGELSAEWRELQAILETADLEELDTLDLDKAFKRIKEARVSKIANCLKLFKYYEGIALGIAAQIDKLKTYKERTERRHEKIQQWLEFNLGPEESFQFDNGEIGWRKSTSVEPTEKGNAVPEAYARIKWEPNKIKMANDLKMGVEIPGWQLVSKNKLKIR